MSRLSVFCYCSLHYRGGLERKDAVIEPTAKVERAASCILMKQLQLELSNVNRRNNPNWFLFDAKRSGWQLNLRMSVLVWGIQLVLCRL